jgi:hypothetical protein
VSKILLSVRVAWLIHRQDTICFCDRLVHLKNISKWEDLLPFTYDKWSETEKEKVAQIEFHHVRCLIGKSAVLMR